MRIYNSFAEVVSEVKRDVTELGVNTKSESFQNVSYLGGDEYDAKELLSYSYELTNTLDYRKYFSKQDLNWIDEEFAERIDHKAINPGRAWKLRSKVWKRFLNKEDQFDYTYNERMRLQLSILIQELIKKPNTRQAVMTILSPLYFQDMFYMGGKKRIPCSLSYQFILRNGYLNVIYSMRSCDVHVHFKFDVALACRLINYVADVLEVRSGNLFHNIGSLHIFRKDMGGIF